LLPCTWQKKWRYFVRVYQFFRKTTPGTSALRMPKANNRPGGVAKNTLLAHLTTDEQDALAAKLETVSLSRGTVLYEQGSAVPFVYFPLSAVVSLLTILEDGSSVEVAIVGHEGLVGLAAYLELERAVVTAVVQLPGDALRIDARQFAM